MPKSKKNKSQPKCGLCGKTGKLVKTGCCDRWICDDSEKYIVFSYARNSCWRNHDRYTLCAYHYHERHKGDWQTCRKCRNGFDPEDYVDMGTNEYNFEKLQHPPEFAPTRCAICQEIIIRAKGGYSIVSGGKGFICQRCGPSRFQLLN